MSDLEIKLSQTALVDSVRDAIVTLLKDMPNKFSQMPEANQRVFLQSAANAALDLVRGACDIIAADGKVTLECSVGKVGINEGTIEAKISAELRQIGRAHV